ncbi:MULTISPECIES: MBL fold metallo-hydrolase [Acidobacteriaceae]|uniref:MBL fold metallo-hydrolase n=1 Tax=Acidobacteriaceae TaxID=204434 RepID=UPI00131EC9FF|nr:MULTISPECIES: MBL fold metallo-hydrolase [Acidobacteriaceae]MDW5266239.1 MBL fold metallo-hydrolase [Edaphobacter sp.]
MTAQGVAPATVSFVTHQMKPNIYWIEGGGGNSTVILGDKGVIVVDAKATLQGGRELLDDMAKITPKPVTTVILTHSDPDHIGGLAAFPVGLTIIAHEGDAKEQQEALATNGRGVPAPDKLPTQVIKKNKETITAEGVTLELYHWAPAHTTGDLIVYVLKDKVVCTGDIIATQWLYPIVHLEKHGTSEGWIASAKGILMLDSDQFIPGHGALQTRADIQKRLSESEATDAKVKELVAQGKSLDEVKAAVGDPAQPQSVRQRPASFTEVVYAEFKK